MMNHHETPGGPDTPPARTESRFESVTRRAFLRRAAQVAGAAAVFPLISACSGDEAVFDVASTTTTLGPAAAVTTQSAPSTTAQPTTTSAPSTTTADGALLDSEMSIAFTYAASSGSRIANPYVAVWIEDSEGELVDTIALWFLQSQKGLRWLTDLRRWSSVDGSDASIDTISSATRTPGDYQVLWDVTDTDGNPVESGDYFVCIEAAREHGPYSLIREAIALAPQSAETALADDGELSAAVVSLHVA